ncbi:hypothetical protein Syun_009059 [Stephania yunnanensis]|uniref:Uncharacterized protein n=1 Tax=Stephania yunnanensis TaxID=152371 RepID=A0AAP0KGG0_9MAGN
MRIKGRFSSDLISLNGSGDLIEGPNCKVSLTCLLDVSLAKGRLLQCCSLDIFACRNNSCLYQVSYGDDSYTVGDGSYTVGDGSYTVGDCISETLTFDDAASVDNIAHGCGHNIKGFSSVPSGFTRGSQPASLMNSLPRPPPR